MIGFSHSGGLKFECTIKVLGNHDRVLYFQVDVKMKHECHHPPNNLAFLEN